MSRRAPWVVALVVLLLVGAFGVYRATRPPLSGDPNTLRPWFEQYAAAACAGDATRLKEVAGMETAAAEQVATSYKGLCEISSFSTREQNDIAYYIDAALSGNGQAKPITVIALWKDGSWRG